MTVHDTGWGGGGLTSGCASWWITRRNVVMLLPESLQVITGKRDERKKISSLV